MKRKNILVIQRGYSLGTNPGDKIRTMNMLDSLTKLGYNVVLLGYYTKRIHLLIKERKVLKRNKYKSVLFFTLPNRYGLSGIAEYLRGIITYYVCKKYAIDIIQAEVSFSATAARFVPDIPLITDFHADLVPELEMAKFSQTAINHAKRENIYALKRSLKTITVSQNLYDNLQKYVDFIKSENVILPCNFKEESFLLLDTKGRLRMRKQYNIQDRIVLCYSGGLHIWQCIKETLEIVICLCELNPRYYFCLFTNDNPSPYNEYLEKLKGNCLIKSLTSSEVPFFLSMIDVGFVLRENSLVNINSSPTKTSEYMAAGAMVVATKYAGDAPQLIKGSGHGFILDDLDTISSEKIKELDDVIVKYYSDYYSCSEKVKQFVFKERVWSSNERQLKQLYEEVERLIDEK